MFLSTFLLWNIWFTFNAGLFNYDHMDYEYNRNSTKEPSLTEMVEFAIKTLQQSPNGFVLLVEGNNELNQTARERIDRSREFQF